MPFQLDQPDSRIPLAGLSSGGQSQSFNPLGTLGQMMQIQEMQAQQQERQQKIQQEQRDAADDEAIRQTMPQFSNPEDGIKALMQQGRTTAAAKMGKQVFDQRQSAAKAYSDVADATGKKIDQVTGMLQGVVAAGDKGDTTLYKSARQKMVDLASDLYGPSANDIFPTEYDPVRLKALLTAGTKRADQLKVEAETSDRIHQMYVNGLIANPAETGGPLNVPGVAAGPHFSQKAVEANQQWMKYAGSLLSQADSGDRWTGYVKGLQAVGMPQPLIDQLPAWNDQNPQASRDAALKFGMLPKEISDAANAAEERRQGVVRLGIEQQQANTAAEKKAGEGEEKPLTTKQETDLITKRNAANAKAKAAYLQETADANLGGKSPTAQAKMNTALQAANDKFIATKLDNENAMRTANPRYNRQSMEEAAQAAIDSGDRAGYDKVRSVYDGLAGAGALEKTYPWKGSNPLSDDASAGRGNLQPGATSAPPVSRPNAAATPATPAASGRPPTLEERRAMIREFPTATPERKAQIQAQLGGVAAGAR